MESPEPVANLAGLILPPASLEFPTVNQDFVLKALKALSPDEYACTNRKKGFYSSYSVWATLSDSNKSKVYAFWSLLTGPVRLKVIREAVAEASRVTEVSIQRREVTMKNDLCRLLELRKYPDALIIWTGAEKSMSRRALDARKSNAPNLAGTPMADESDPWGRLAGIFNDYENFCPQNPMIKYHDVGGIPTPIAPFIVSNQKYTILAAHCFDLNPSDLNRREIRRDGAWIKEHWLNMRALLSPIFADFDRSGKQSHRDEAEVEWMSEEETRRWVYHSSNKSRPSPTVCMYSYAIMERSDFEQLGRAMETGAGQDYSLRREGSVRDRNDKRVKRHKRGVGTMGTSGDDKVAIAIDLGSQRSMQMDALKFMAMNGDASQKAEAMQQIMKISLGQEAKTNQRVRGSSPGAFSSSGGGGGDSDYDDNDDIIDDTYLQEMVE